jgi:hypothetical protein
MSFRRKPESSLINIARSAHRNPRDPARRITEPGPGMETMLENSLIDDL